MVTSIATSLTEEVIFGMCQCFMGLDVTGSINVDGNIFEFNDALKLLDVMLDALLSFDNHVTIIIPVVTFHTCAYGPFVRCCPWRQLKQLLHPLWGADLTTATASYGRTGRNLVVFSGCSSLWHLISKPCRQLMHLISYSNYTGCL